MMKEDGFSIYYERAHLYNLLGGYNRYSNASMGNHTSPRSTRKRRTTINPRSTEPRPFIIASDVQTVSAQTVSAPITGNC